MESTDILPEGYKPQPQDILCGKTKLAFNHVGNLDFRATVAMFLRPYEALRSRTERGVLIANVVDMIHSSGCRFLKQNADGRWVVQTTQQSRSKVGHALRDTAANTKGNTAVENKRPRLEPPPPFPQPVPQAPSIPQPPSVPQLQCQNVPQQLPCPQVAAQFLLPPPQAVVYTGLRAGAQQHLKQHLFDYYYGRGKPTDEERKERRSSHGTVPCDEEEGDSYPKRTPSDEEKERHSGGEPREEYRGERRFSRGIMPRDGDEGEKPRNHYGRMPSNDEEEGEQRKIYTRMSSDEEEVENGGYRSYYRGTPNEEARGKCCECCCGRMRRHEEIERRRYYDGKMPGQGGKGAPRNYDSERKEYQFISQPKVNGQLLAQSTSTTPAEMHRQQTNQHSVAFDGEEYYNQEKEESDDDNDDRSTSPPTTAKVQPEVVSSSSQHCRKRSRDVYGNDSYDDEYNQDASREEEEDESIDEPSDGQELEEYGGEPDQDVDEEQGYSVDEAIVRSKYTIHNFEAPPEHVPSCTTAAVGDDGVVQEHDGYVYRDHRWHYVGKDGPPAAAPTDDDAAEVSSVVSDASDSSDDCYQDFDDFVCQRQPRMGVRA